MYACVWLGCVCGWGSGVNFTPLPPPPVKPRLRARCAFLHIPCVERWRHPARPVKRLCSCVWRATPSACSCSCVWRGADCTPHRLRAAPSARRTVCAQH
eukprot:55772-Chlamydomonas_euryale.AAC.2